MRRAGLLAVAVAALALGVGIGNAGSLVSLLAVSTPTQTPTIAVSPTATSTSIPSSTPSATSSPTATPTRTAAQLLKAVVPSVLRIRTEDGEGTGFVVFEKGQVMTAAHVVRAASSRPTVIAPDATEYRSVVLGLDEERDLALLTVPGLPAPPLALSTDISIGDTVLAVGYAAGLPGDASMTRGIVSAKRIEPETGLRILQTDAPINPGNSGGPLFNEAGQVVGVNIGRLRGSRAQYENMGFAVSANEIRLVADSLQAGLVRLVPMATARPAPTTRPQVPGPPGANAYVVRKYTVTTGKSGASMVYDWSDGTTTIPSFFELISSNSPIYSDDPIVLAFKAHPGSVCDVWIPIYDGSGIGTRQVLTASSINGIFVYELKFPAGSAWHARVWFPVRVKCRFAGEEIEDYVMVEAIPSR